MQKNVEKRPNLEGTYNEFIAWTALPAHERHQLGILTQGEFAEYHKINKDTLTRWKNRSDFELRLNQILKDWAKGKTADIVQGIYRSAVKGNAKSQRLWLEYFKNWKPPKISKNAAQNQPAVHPNLTNRKSVHYIISLLPPERQARYYELFRELVIEAKAASEDVPLPEWTHEKYDTEWLEDDDPTSKSDTREQ